jgi:hypothetical protein
VLCLTGKQGSLQGFSILLVFFHLQTIIPSQAACFKEHLVKWDSPGSLEVNFKGFSWIKKVTQVQPSKNVLLGQPLFPKVTQAGSKK